MLLKTLFYKKHVSDTITLQRVNEKLESLQAKHFEGLFMFMHFECIDRIVYF